MSSPDRAGSTRERWTMVLIVGVVVASIAAWLATGNLGVALAPIAAVVVVTVLARLPLHQLAIGLFFLAMIADNPKEHPAQGQWQSPIYPLGLILYENLNTITGIQPLRFAAIDLILALMLALIGWRTVQRHHATPVPRPLHLAITAMVCGLVWLEIWGVGRGGDFKSSLWQIRPPIWYAAIAWVFIGSIRGAIDLPAIGRCVVVGAVVKVSMGFFFYWFICRPKNLRPDFVTTHSDSVIFVTALMIVTVAWLEAPERRSGALTLGLIAFYFLGIIINGRRLAYIELTGALAAIYSLSSNVDLRARLHKIVRIAGPPLAVYLAVGWRSSSSIFAPAAKIATLFSGNDRSAGTRDIENYNLIITWKDHLLLGGGLGHPYNEVSVADSIADIFPLYRFIGHNSVLWLFSVGGYVGFACVWISLSLAIYFAALAHRRLTDPIQRTGAAAALCAIVCFMLQAYGDMGMQSWSAAFLFGMAVSVAGKLAVSSGAWSPTDNARIDRRSVRRA